MSASAAPAPAVDNPTRAFIAEAVGAGRRELRLDVNPALAELSTVLVEGAPGEVSLRFTARHATTQGNGVVGGGTLAGMLDAAMAVAVLSRLAPGQTCATISLSVHMQAAALAGDLYAVARVERLGRRVAFANAQLFGGGRERLVASGSASLSILGASA